MYVCMCPKLVVVPETIDAVRQLILQDRQVTSRKIETTLGISGTCIHSILNMNIWLPKKIYARWIPQNLPIAQKNARVDWSKEMLQTHDRSASKHVYDIVTGDILWIYAYEPES